VFRYGFPEATPGAGRIIIDRSAEGIFQKRQYDPVDGYVAIPTLQRNTIRSAVTIRDRKNDNARLFIGLFPRSLRLKRKASSSPVVIWL
jgi:hypothetical protein